MTGYRFRFDPDEAQEKGGAHSVRIRIKHCEPNIHELFDAFRKFVLACGFAPDTYYSGLNEAAKELPLTGEE